MLVVPISRHTNSVYRLRQCLSANHGQSFDGVKHFSFNGTPVGKLVVPGSGWSTMSLAIGLRFGRKADLAYGSKKARRKGAEILGIWSDGRMGSTVRPGHAPKHWLGSDVGALSSLRG
jgi:hypothetical protein